MYQAVQAPMTQTGNRWRFHPVETVTGSAQQDGSAPATHPLVELFAAGTSGTGPVQVRFVPPGWHAPSVPLWVTRTEFDRLCLTGSRVAALLPEHDALGAYAPLGGVAFVGAAHPRDVKQGKLGSCRCASAFQAVAAAPAGPAHLAKIVTAIHNGPFEVRLQSSNAPSASTKSTASFITILVDNHLPVDLTDGNALYQLRGRRVGDPPNGFALWPALLEKAIATMWGSYELVQDSQLAKITEDIILRALGIGPLGINSKLNTMSGTVTPEKLCTFVTAARKAGAAITAAASWQRHNFAVVDADADGMIMSDPNTGFTPEDLARWTKPNRIGPHTPSSMLVGGDVWPIYVTWAQAIELFQWFYTYDVAGAK